MVSIGMLYLMFESYKSEVVFGVIRVVIRVTQVMDNKNKDKSSKRANGLK